ncbi:MAG: hypothetical protein JWO08_1817 [Verrucomicrobiaceae bacterium]|nr:hypothetical protein [Verrucomicrobiaceae bacterium]
MQLSLLRSSAATTLTCVCGLLALSTTAVKANGLDRNGVGARSMSMAGASMADTEDPFASMALNPSALGFIIGSDLSLSGTGVTGSGKYEDQYGNRGRLSDDWKFLPDVVFRRPLSKDVGLGFSVIPDSSRSADWYFRDPAGGAGGATSYGFREYHSEILNIRAALGLGWRITDSLSLGASLGGVYTRNELKGPYIFQSHPALAGMKTLLDMETDGYGINGDLGLTWKASKTLTFGLAYRTPTKFDTSGEATGDIGAQLRSLGITGVPTKFRYDSDIETKLPQKVGLGTSWQATERLRLSAQVDWINWSEAFDQLDVHLSKGSNPAINGLLGTDKIDDTIALKWKDRFVYRAGAEYALTDKLCLRAGYVYGQSPVPDSTLLPMTAAISEHTVAIGLGYNGGSYHLDLAYQRDLGASQRAGVNGITGTEYDNSKVRIDANWLALTVGFKF